MKRVSITVLCLTLVAAAVALKECSHSSMDLMFVLDGSASVGERNWEVVKTWLNTFVSSLDIEKVHVGVVQFSHWGSIMPSEKQLWTKTEVKLGKISNLTDFKESVNNIPFYGYTTYTAHAINKTVNDDFMKSERFKDSSVKKVMILMTDGKSSDAAYLTNSAEYARSAGIIIFGIGVGKAVKEELQIIASGEVGNNERVLAVDNFSELDDTVASLQTDICTPVHDNSNGCSERCLDLIFLLDGSGSVGPTNWELIKTWVKSFVDKLDLKKSVAVGVVEYSIWVRGAESQKYVKTEIELGEYKDVNSFYRALDKIPLYGYTTYTAHAINKTVNEDFMESSCFDDPSVKKIMILLTDGRSSDHSELAGAASHARANQISIYAIGVGSGVDLNELQIIASGELGNNKHIYPFRGFSTLLGPTGSLKSDINAELSGSCSV